MIIAAGIVVIKDHKEILLVHPSNSKWYGTYGIPKGIVEETEDSITDAAIREFKEEVGIDIEFTHGKSLLQNNRPKYIDYKDKSGKTYKRIFYFEIFIHDYNEIGLTKSVVPRTQLQLEEVDWAGFVPFTEALENRMMAKQFKIIENIGG